MTENNYQTLINLMYYLSLLKARKKFKFLFIKFFKDPSLLVGDFFGLTDARQRLDRLGTEGRAKSKNHF